MNIKTMFLYRVSHNQLAPVYDEDILIFRHCSNNSHSVEECYWEIVVWPVLQCHGYNEYEIVEACKDGHPDKGLRDCCKKVGHKG